MINKTRKSLLGLFMALLLLLPACGQKASEPTASATWQEQYDLGLRYLSEGNYREAILAFTAAIEIDAKQAKAYVGRGDAYVGMAKLAMPEGAAAPEGEALNAYQSAAADYVAAVGLDTTMVEVYQKAAEVYMILGDTDAAASILQKGIDSTGDQSLSDALAKLEQGEGQGAAGSQGEEAASNSSNSPEAGSETAALTIDFDPEALLGQNISVITDQYGEPTEDFGTSWRWCAEDYSYDFQMELGSDGATIMSVLCGWGGPAILGVKPGDSAEAAEAALRAVGDDFFIRDAGNGQTNYSISTTDNELLYDFAVMDGSVVYVSVHQLLHYNPYAGD